MTSPSTTPTTAADPERSAPPFSPSIVEEVIRQLDKTIRARQLYLANNPTFLRAVETLRACFAPVWAGTDEVVLAVTESQFTWCGVVVHQQPEKATDSLPWLCHKDGLREITLRRGVEDGEIQRFIELIPRVRRAAADGDDLIALMWEQEFTAIDYRFVDVGGDGADTPTAGAEPGRQPDAEAQETPADAVEAAREEEAAGGTAAAPSGVVSMDDFDATLYFLDDAEIRYIREELEAEYAMDLRAAVLNKLFDILELQPDPRVRSETMGIINKLLLHLLAAARFDTVAYLIRESRTVLDRARELEPALRQELQALPQRLSAPETLGQVLQQLDDSPTLPAAADLDLLFSELSASALAPILSWLGRVREPALRTLLAAAAERLAASGTAELVRLIGSADEAVAAEAMRRAGALRTPAAVAPLAKWLTDPRRALRLVAVQALIEVGSAGALQALDRALSDADREIRVAVVRALAVRGQRSSLAKVEAVIKGKEIRDAELSERMAFFEAYGALAGESAVAYLDGLLNGKSGLFGRREDPGIRACAAIGLGRIAGGNARAALERASSEKDVVVRSAVTKALRGAS
jgi:hypothetical protein